MTADSRGPVVPFREAVRAFARVGVQSFGGPAAQIAVLHRVVVEEKRWISDERFLHALQFCMLLPGPEAMQLTTYVGWMLHGVRGGIVAGALFVLPGAACMLAISVLYAVFRDVPAVDAVFFGVKAGVLAIVAEAVVRVGRRALRGRPAVFVAVLSFVALRALDAPFPVVVAGAAACGFLAPRAFAAPDESGPPSGPRPSWGRLAVTAAAGLVLWWAPVAALLVLAPQSVFAEQSLFFSKVSVVTFGGAYAVLSYVQQQAVERYAWVTPGQMLDGLGLAETTPGPLILVLQFVAFAGAFARPEGLDPVAAGVLASAVMLWTTFVPCLLWIFAFAPWVEAARSVRALSGALAAITACVVGVIASLGVSLAVHTLFREVGEVRAGPVRAEVPAWASADPAAVVLAAAAGVMLLRLKWGIGRTLGACAAAGLAWKLVSS